MAGRKTYTGTAIETTLAAGINSTDTTITLANGSTYGAPTVGAPMVIVVGAETASEEQILISARSANVLTVAASGRNWHAGGGTTGVSHAMGEVVRHVLDADSINDANRHVNVDTDDDHSQYHNDARHDVTARHTFGAGLGTPAAAAAVLLTGTGTTGSGTVPSRSDHGHAYNPPACRVYHNTTQSLTTATLTVLAFNSEREDTDTMHDTVTNNSRITIKTAGRYQVTAHVTFASNATGERGINLWVNGATYVAGHNQMPVTSGSATIMSLTTSHKFAVNDYIEVVGFQGSGGALNILASDGTNERRFADFSAEWVGVG